MLKIEPDFLIAQLQKLDDVDDSKDEMIFRDMEDILRSESVSKPDQLSPNSLEMYNQLKAKLRLINIKINLRKIVSDYELDEQKASSEDKMQELADFLKYADRVNTQISTTKDGLMNAIHDINEVHYGTITGTEDGTAVNVSFSNGNLRSQLIATIKGVGTPGDINTELTYSTHGSLYATFTNLETIRNAREKGLISTELADGPIQQLTNLFQEQMELIDRYYETHIDKTEPVRQTIAPENNDTSFPLPLATSYDELDSMAKQNVRLRAFMRDKKLADVSEIGWFRRLIALWSPKYKKMAAQLIENHEINSEGKFSLGDDGKIYSQAPADLADMDPFKKLSPEVVRNIKLSMGDGANVVARTPSKDSEKTFEDENYLG